MQPLSTFVAFIALTVPTVTAHTPINGVMYSQPSRGLLQHSLCLDGEGCMSLHAFESTDDAVHRALAVMHTKTNKTESTHLSKLASTPNSRSTHGIICTGPMQTYCYHYRRLEATDEDEDDDEEVQEQIQQAQEAKKLKCERHLWGFVCEE
ncbi:hypothetical protein Poli38472_007786 [Pythium oligandrum]|uniref:Uncharacterized protein n=1 Tax=Pythium oligandrum TaxID=41045 RepID=A0A8K1FP83_PYTOL|nr:hypothetical protein Poli38472_007786 [Pythium oligandrum]|eukprot:TMW68114.1 hypothetical protein Poli38472_007786 [Pythium oligandrum]